MGGALSKLRGESMKKQKRYQIVQVDGGWNVVDCDQVTDPRDGEKVGRTHPTKQAALNHLRELVISDHAGGLLHKVLGGRRRWRRKK